MVEAVDQNCSVLQLQERKVGVHSQTSWTTNVVDKVNIIIEPYEYTQRTSRYLQLLSGHSGLFVTRI